MSGSRAEKYMRATLIGALAVFLAACASIGRPEGGPRDRVPPEFVKSDPAPGATNVSKGKVEITFDENIKLEDVTNLLVVSPAQKQMPVIRSNGKKVTVELSDSLLPNTTYTFDFADAIRDLNEGNILDGFTTSFATGDSIDTLRISGMVFEARTLEPAQGMVVGVYNTLNFTDTSLMTLPFERVSKTNQYGQFTIHNLKAGEYRLFAVDDKNRDWHWDESENIAFYDVPIIPTAERVEVSDTLQDILGEDSIVIRSATRYLPDDILLTWFNVNNRSQYLRDYERNDRKKITIKFGAPADSLPFVTLANGPMKGRNLSELAVIETRQDKDSVVYWLADSNLVKQDSILLSVSYLKTDSLKSLSPATDTLKLFMRTADLRAEREKEKAFRKKLEDWEKESAKPGGDTIPRPEMPVEFVDFKMLTSSSQELHKPVEFEASAPLRSIDTSGWRLEMMRDTLWFPVPEVELRPDSLYPRRYTLNVPWVAGAKYRFQADSAAIVDIYGNISKGPRHEFTVKTPEDYGNIIFNITDIAAIPDSVGLIVELLNASDAVVDTALVVDGQAVFRYVTPGNYYARAFIDGNNNSEWDRGDVMLQRQAEDVFYYLKKLNLKKNWDIEQSWSLFETAVDLQKPEEIKKNKPRKRGRNERNRDNSDIDDEEEDDSGFGQDHFFGDDSWGNGSQYNNAGSRHNSGKSRPGLKSARDY